MPHIHLIALRLSLYCSLLAVSLVSFDESPLIAYWVLPHRPAYYISLLGILLFMLSDKFVAAVLKQKKLLLFITLILLWGGIATVIGGFRNCDKFFCDFYANMYFVWRVIPFLFLYWFALLFSSVPRDEAKRIFCLGLLVLFLSNAIHMTLEILANLGFGQFKDFLISVNPFIRAQKIGHGWWPPVYFEHRVRGLFAEPSHMGAGLLVLFGLFYYKGRLNLLYKLCFVLLSIYYLAARSYSGLLSLGLFLVLVNFQTLYNYIMRNKMTSVIGGVAMLLVALGAGGGLFARSPAAISFAIQADNAAKVARYCRDVHEGNTNARLALQEITAMPIHAFDRLASLFMDVDIARRYPLGIGYVQRGFYWQCLAQENLSGLELGLWVEQAGKDKYKGTPQLSEFGSLVAEQGYVGLVLFLVFYFSIARRSYLFARRTNDDFMYALTAAYCSMIIVLLFIPLANFFMFYYFTGFLYAMSTPPVRNSTTPGLA